MVRLLVGALLLGTTACAGRASKELDRLAVDLGEMATGLGEFSAGMNDVCEGLSDITAGLAALGPPQSVTEDVDSETPPP